MKFNVLIVDDSAVMRKIIARSLRQAACDQLEEVHEAGDGVEALEKLGQHDIGVIFADVNMPNMDGLELMRQISEGEHSAVPVVMVTTEGAEKTIADAISLGAVGFVRKPFQASQLETVIGQALERMQSAPA